MWPWDRWRNKRIRRWSEERYEEWTELSRAISDEVDQQRAEICKRGTTYEVRVEAKGKAAGTQLSPYGSDRLDPLLVPAAIRQLVTDAIDVINTRHKRAEGRQPLIRPQPWLSLREEEEDAARRERAAEAAPDLLARAGISAGRDELKIATLLLTRREDATTEQMQQAVKAFKDAYERRVQRYKDTGGQTAWPTADGVILLLFGRQ
ncbi:hypothetical protein ABTZ93_39410 [Streptomyces sp. NPDC097941]|uniref:Uncharacterized protein n=1 Tax=Streptomyces turgidiscabies TaxID=85558 RepID=A0ABU0RVN6_9ACTN|nr:hypothetical protein [Streptomyces turgidiscabies]MDQ0935222.1 hypothetical protein [Streptomyces turgidiscabies]